MTEPYITFVDGTPLTPARANAIANPVFDGLTQYLGHLPKITDADLSDSGTAIKARVAGLSTNLQVTQGSGLLANYAAGVAIYGVTKYDIAAGSVSLTANATNYIFVNISGAVTVSTSLPTVCGHLATVVTNGTGTVTLTDMRDDFRVAVVKPTSTSLRNFGGRGEQGAFTATNGQTLSDGEYYYTSFTVPNGVTLNIDKMARVYCTGNVTIAGTVVVSDAQNGARRLVTAGLGMRISGGAGGGFGGGIGEESPPTYNYLVSPYGSGGSGGGADRDDANSVLLQTTLGGHGGGCFWLEAAGAITVTGTITANGTAGASGSVSTGTTSGTIWAVGGAGGGSGGLILLRSLVSIVYSGTASANGGAGGNGNAGNGTRAAEAGSGGGGGIIALFAPTVNTTGWTATANGGAAGTNSFSGAGVLGNGGVGGSFGGAGGTQVNPGGNPGSAGRILTRTYTPIG